MMSRCRRAWLACACAVALACGQGEASDGLPPSEPGSDALRNPYPGSHSMNLGVDLRGRLGGRSGAAAFYGVGSLYDTADRALGMEVRGFAGSGANSADAGGSAGAFYRALLEWGGLGQAMLEANVYHDHEWHDQGGFSRWSAGSALRSSWVDAFVNYYLPVTERREASSGIVYYTAEGLDAAMHLHAPSRRWITAVFRYYDYGGRNGGVDESGWVGGAQLRLPHLQQFYLEGEYDEGAKDKAAGGRFVFMHRFRDSDSSLTGLRGRFLSRSWFFAPGEREATQRIRPLGATN